MKEEIVIGIDEAGRGPVIGPMVIGGVIGPPKAFADLAKEGVKDSKKLTPGRREYFAKKIKGQFTYHAEVLKAEEIDSLRKQMSLNLIEAKDYAKVLAHLLVETGADLDVTVAYVDSVDVKADRFAETIRSFLPDTLKKVKIVSKHKADDIYPVVSSASILAKTTRDGLVEEIEQELGGKLGSGYPSDPVTKKFLKEWVEKNGDVPPHVRRSWKTVDELLKSRNKKYKTLDDYS